MTDVPGKVGLEYLGATSMAPLDLVSLLAGIIGTLVTVWVAFVGKQLLKPRFSVEVGLFDRKLFNAPNRWLSRQVDAIAVGVSALEAKQIFLRLLVRLQNRGSLPVSDVDVVIEFAKEALIEEVGIVGPIGGETAMFTGDWPEGREISCFRGMAQCRIPIGLVRPGETIVTGEVIQLRAGLLASTLGAGTDEKAEILRQRYSSCEQLRSALQVRISVWSSSMKTKSLSVMMIWLAVKNPSDLKDALGKMSSLSAAAGPIKPGVYLLSRPWKRFYRDELVEVAMIDASTVEDLKEALSSDKWDDNTAGAVVLRVPPWGLWGESFDIEAEWNAKLLRQYDT